MRGAKGGAGRKGIDHETQPAGLWPPTRANGQVAFGVYAIEPETGSYLPIALDVLTLRGDLISDVTAFRARCAILFGFLTAVFAEVLKQGLIDQVEEDDHRRSRDQHPARH
jgi:hypothetical protein